VHVRRVVWTLLLALWGQPALAFDLNILREPQTARVFYFGVGANDVHHTGYVPGTRWSEEIWRPGGKVLVGWRPFGTIGLEGAYYYLGQGSFTEGAAVRSTESSHALSGSLLAYTPALSMWSMLDSWPTRLFARVGTAAKFIHHRGPFGALDEAGISYQLGFGIEVDLTSSVFVRVEYEYISKIIGGTDRVINVQHTPISAVMGVRF
jgi:opacity protein-like surface antigen